MHGQTPTRFSSKLSELRNTLFAAPEIVPAMSRAASIFLSVMKAGFCWMASPIRRAEVASPCALIMALCLSCSALSTCTLRVVRSLTMLFFSIFLRCTWPTALQTCDMLPKDDRLGHAHSSGCRRHNCSKTCICTDNYSSYNEARSLCFLLCHLFSFNGTCVFSAKSKVGDGNIIQIYVEVLRSLCQNPPDVSANHLHSQSTILMDWISRQTTAQYAILGGSR